MATALRTSLIWHDEVMGDVVHERPAPVTLGATSAATFTTPSLALPEGFSILTPGRRGYVLTLSSTMSGTIRVGGVEHDVAAFVRANDDGSGFYGTALGPDDWGVIALDDGGEHKLFFQFVPHEVEDWNLGHPLILAGVGGYALSALALTAFWWRDGVALGEAAFRGGSVASLAIGLAAIVRWAFKQSSESRASLAFSVLLHSAILLLTFQLYEKESPAIWPGPASLTGTYLVRATEAPPEPPPVPVKPTVTATATAKPAAAMPVARRDDRASVPPTTVPWKHVARPTLPKDPRKSAKQGSGLLAHTDILDDVAGDRGVKDVIHDMKRIDGTGGGDTPELGAGNGHDTRGGDPDGTSGSGPVGKAGPAKKGGLDTGPERAAVCFVNCGGGGNAPIDVDAPSDQDGGPTLSKEDIAKVMGARQGLFRACYQAALDRGGANGGDLVVRFVIDGEGKVTSASTVSGSINSTVASCVKQKLFLLRFPKKGGAIVRHFPFVFTSN